MPAALPIGRITGHRGTSGEVTVRVGSGDAERWAGVRAVELDGGPGLARLVGVEAARAYRDRLVLKLQGVDDPGQAEALRGVTVCAPAGQRPVLPGGTYWVADLVGLAVADDGGQPLGTVVDVVEAGGGHLLRVETGGAGGPGEVLVPLVREIVLDVDLEERLIRVRLPEGLCDLNRAGEGRP